ncbi:protein MOTHER of FT and TFL1 homolog 1-like [Gastrolobium bilobum]|uniref:protein MOTHER of FT and TFL1 homolog 1-like n=1 Tax=Gastrolobium bilobum TaxID=150636 RepID=UPI002AB0E564|nr:protein MOTHER of FT and TFL1 homolog 1-like [Gastrolobium bilobum]
MNRSIEVLTVGKIIGDVVDPFAPAAEITILYGSKQVANGCDIKPSLAAERPHVRILGASNSGNLYTLVMVDPDAPSPSEPTYREWLHWIVVDIPEGSDASQGREVVMYMGPCPLAGIHRYVFVAFKQTDGPLVGVGPPQGRANFKSREFASRHHLGLPVAAVYFHSQKEPKNKKRQWHS